MSLAKRNIRGLQDIRTHSGRVDETHLASKAYLKVACLEMEKVRRGKERESAACRIENIDARFDEIAAEKATLLRSLSEQESANFNGVSCNAARPAPRRKEPGFKLKY
jgi:hypothetical protein